MILTVDGIKSNEYPNKFSIGDLLRYMDVEDVPWLVISVNDKFYKRDKFDQTYLKNGDCVELVYIRGGG